MERQPYTGRFRLFPPAYFDAGRRDRCSRRLIVKILINSSRAIRTNAGHLCEIRKGGVFDRLQGAEMHQERPLAGGANARNFLQAGLTDVALAPRPMRSD